MARVLTHLKLTISHRLSLAEGDILICLRLATVAESSRSAGRQAGRQGLVKRSTETAVGSPSQCLWIIFLKSVKLLPQLSLCASVAPDKET